MHARTHAKYIVTLLFGSIWRKVKVKHDCKNFSISKRYRVLSKIKIGFSCFCNRYFIEYNRYFIEYKNKKSKRVID